MLDTGFLHGRFPNRRRVVAIEQGGEMATGVALVLRKAFTQLVPLAEINRALQDVSSIDDMADFSRKVEAARKYDSETAERRNYWGSVSLESTARLGELIRAGQAAGEIATTGRPREKAATLAAFPKTLADVLGVDNVTAQHISSRSQRVATVPAEKRAEYVAECARTDEEVTRAGLIRYAVGAPGRHTHVSLNTGCPEWYTPAEYVEAARSTLGEIDLDPASSKVAQQTVKAKRYYTVQQDGLSKKWSGRVFLNPPYTAELVDKFVQRLVDGYVAADIAAAILLVNNATETKWFQLAAERSSALCFPASRIKFIDDQGNPGAPLQGQAVLYFGCDYREFVSQFGSFGFMAFNRSVGGGR